jgi:hypothetical protein
MNRVPTIPFIALSARIASLHQASRGCSTENQTPQDSDAKRWGQINKLVALY